MGRRKGAVGRRDVNKYSEEHSTDALYRDLQRHTQPKAAELYDYFVEIRTADKEFWTTVLWENPQAFLFWIQSEIPKVKPEYMQTLEAFDIEEMCSRIETFKNRHRWTSEMQREANACAERLAGQLAVLDVGHILWRRAIEIVTSGERPVDFKTRKFEAYAEAVTRKDKQIIELRNYLVVSNLRFAIKVAIKQARNNKRNKVWYADLVQDASIGLMEAVNRFDPTLGFSFTTYAAYWIRNAMDRGRAASSRTVRQPVRIAELKNKIAGATSKYMAQYNRRPTDEELCSSVTNLTPGVLKGLEFISQKPAQSLNLVVPALQGGDRQDSPTFQELVEDTFPSMEDIHEHDQVIEQLYAVLRSDDVLNFREKKILSAYFGLDNGVERTLEEIGGRWSVSRERIRQLRDGALLKVREAFLERNIVKEDCLSAFARLSDHRSRGATHQLSQVEK